MTAREKLFKRIYGDRFKEMPKSVNKLNLYARVYDLLKEDRMLVETEDIQSGPFKMYRDDILSGNEIGAEVMENMFNVRTYNFIDLTYNFIQDPFDSLDENDKAQEELDDNYRLLEDMWENLVESKFPGFGDSGLAIPAVETQVKAAFNPTGFNWDCLSYK